MTSVDEPVHVVAYDPAWVELGSALVARVRGALRGLTACEVEHIGSTAVPGLDAKPVIDVQVGCVAGEFSVAVARVRELGFEHLGEAGVPGREYLRRRAGQAANVHVMALDGPLWAANLAFRDHLRAHPETAARYARVKREAALAAGSLLAYSELKAATVADIMRAAR
ncbi:GrpB family protein [Kitasatospora sp. NPDC059722]|uniref:GrpB family protein n=1 Tax=Kitasatospora sp. NPDC059722 TaxID=3346925 RepID=UPI0036A4CF10